MSGTGFFPPPRYSLGAVFKFQYPTDSEWTITAKKSQKNHQLGEKDAQNLDNYSYSTATFMVKSNLDAREGFMRVYVQVPHEGQEFFPREERAKQAATSSHREVSAMKAFHAKESTITPQIFGLEEATQDDEGFVPGGYVIHMVTQRLSGTRLADDLLAPGYGHLNTFFQKFTRIQRDKIRVCFDNEFLKLLAMGWLPDFEWATHLIWNESLSTLHFFDFRCAYNRSEDYLQPIALKTTKLDTWSDWGLATPLPRLLGVLTRPILQSGHFK
ncbi:uncharacterized protein N7483_010880 [Penicillium malachiteum]|uniref:uncharacterized protein n=1 Tax=Penicillium malachiteum TaxID=1324776 RepID=UPI002546B535|nr:uncharacterized protein N7483_010880 [Penicillium malachiteum]KAJ5713699.1 hypothetical protein N7483_010880 [Penicillium malachiteum]